MPEYNPPPVDLPPGSLVFAYLRDSGGPTQEGSTAQQEREIVAYCRVHGLALTHIFSDVARSGGKVDGRAQFMAMIDATKDPATRPQGLIIWNFARFSRDVDDSDYYKSMLRKRGVVIHSLTDMIPDGPYARLVEKVIDIANEEKRRQNSRDVKRGLAALVREGFSPGIPPRGYKAVQVSRGETRDGKARMASRWEPDPELFPLVQLAWRMRAEGASYKQIQEATGGKLYRSINCWVDFFRNRSYLGIARCGELEFHNHHPPAITPETWEAVKRVERKPRTGINSPRSKAYPSLLAGLSICSHCGAAMVHHKGHNWPYYICGTKDRKGNLCPNARRIGARKVETLVIETVLNRILTPAFVKDLLEETRLQLQDTIIIEREIETRREALKITQRGIMRLLDLLESGQLDTQDVKDRLKQREGEKARLLYEINQLEARLQSSQIEITPEALALALSVWRGELEDLHTAGDVAALRRTLTRFITKIELDYTHVRICYTYPIDGLITPKTSQNFGGT
ncbi:MAG: hypothetical protein DDG60_00740 [Anaerolineae bacterium]|nr:MAG: hypothetical protein DDG60_00740 [Anaerolineae bacterium]